MSDRFSPTQAFLHACEAAGFELSSTEHDRLGRYLWLLLDANQRFNLTAVRDPDEAWMRHVFDSLTLLPHLIEAGKQSVIDVGSGGGLPGSPLAICLPDVQVTMLEATGKKARFIDSVIADLPLTNAAALNERSETAGQSPRHREAYDVAIARAVGPMRVMLELTLPLVRVGGRVLAMKGRRVTEELDEAGDALMRIGGGNVELFDAVSDAESEAVIVSIEKTSATPKAFPRRPGEPKTNPL